MSKIESLIKELCPDGVEYKKIGDFCEIKTGKGITKSDATSGGMFPIISGGQIPMGYYHKFNRRANTVTISRVGAYAGFVSYIQTDFYLNDKCFSVIPTIDNISTRFLFHILKYKEEKIKGLQSEGGVPTINTTKVGSIEIPVPPLPVQEEIVRILDSFTELEKELEKRKKQYEYYRNKLLSFSEIGGGTQVKWVKLSEIATIYRGVAYSKKDFTETGMPCIHYGQIYTRYGTFANKTFTYVNEDFAFGKRLAKKGDIIMAVTSENLEDVGKCLAWLGEDNILVSNHACFIRHSLNPKYFAYFFQTSFFFNYKKKICKGVKVIDLNLSQLEDMPIPVPTMEEQERIVSILDKFEAMVNDISVGLPAEIEARHKQYEYYRNKLLTFKQKIA